MVSKPRKWKKKWGPKPVSFAAGGVCPKCKKTMERFSHPPEWCPKEGQTLWYAYWDKCYDESHRPHIQLYEAAKRFAKKRSEDEQASFERVDPLTQEWKAVVG